MGLSRIPVISAICASQGEEMIVADISETKARLSSFVAAVQAGDEVIITERGRSVARIVREPNESTSNSDRRNAYTAAEVYPRTAD